MEITFWGVRGSIPAPGPETNRYGGNTACVSVRTRSGHLIILDAGTGISPLGRALMQDGTGHGQLDATLLLTHAHWDHIQGFPFFPPIYVPGNKLDIFGPSRSSNRLEGILEGQMNPHFSPIHSLRNLGAAIEIKAVHEGVEFEAAGVKISGVLNPHGKTKALAYRIQEGGENGKAMVYAPDAGYSSSGPPPRSLELYHGAHVLIHDCTYTPEDRALRIQRGFSSIAEAADAAVQAQVRQLVMFHYDQDYTDDMVDVLRDRCRTLLDEAGGKKIKLVAASEGLTLTV
ncbi:MAG TPA: MBL fold metallo-hydrolase [Polyangia bacterium]|jgi:phosphoribosyl 1,2-cyclic phosphodiesterase